MRRRGRVLPCPPLSPHAGRNPGLALTPPPLPTPVDKIGEALGKIFEGVEGCSTARCAPDRRQLKIFGDTALDGRSPRSLALTPPPDDERWSFFRKDDGTQSPDACRDDNLSNASTHSLERFSLPCRGSDRASSIKRVSWNAELCTEAGKLLGHREPAALAALAE